MSIKQQIEDAQFLVANGRKIGALMLLMLAIAASSRKMFPKPTRSWADPNKEMGDAEAFKLFLGGRIRKLLFGSLETPEAGESGFMVKFRGKQSQLEHIFYKYYRCELIHEGELPPNVEFVESQESAGQFTFGVSDNRVMLDSGWLDVLAQAVIQAPVNGPEFGIPHFDLTPKVRDENVLISEVCERAKITPGRFAILKRAVFHISPSVIVDSEDAELKRKFGELVSRGVVNGGMLAGLRSYNLTDEHDVLQDAGLNLLREIAGNYDLVQVMQTS